MGKNKVLDSWKQNYIERGEKLGEGGNGEVFCVEKNQEIFALKRLKSKYVNSKSELAKEKRCRFIKEIDIVRDSMSVS
jgi:serine/threonine protein kinase